MQIAICCTKNWYIYQVINLYALFKHNNVKKVYMFIEDDDIPYITDKRVKFINVNKLKEYVTSNSPNYNTQYSKLSYLRCYFSKILECDKILYIDADAIVVDNIEDLWHQEFNDNVLIGVREPGEWSKHLGIAKMDNKYINSGVLLMNLKKIREEHLDDKMINLLNHKYYAFPDQDVINIVCKDRIGYVSNKYNSTETTGFRDDAKIIHYIRERKGWIKTSPRSEIWYNYHDEYLKGEGKMDNYFVRATRNFDDVQEGVHRIKGKSEWWCSAERYEFLKANNAVELIEIKKVEEPKIVEVVETTNGTFGYGEVEVTETKPKKKITKKSKK